MPRRAAAASRLLVLSADLSSAQSVTYKLLELCVDCTGDVPEAAPCPNVTALTLQTKYYRARVDAHLHLVLDNEPAPELQHELCEYEAVLVVVSFMQPESFLHLRGLAKRVAETNSCDVRLVLVTGTSEDTTKHVAQMESWCQDNGFELVALNAAEESRREYSDLNEKHGIERVLEALECNRWNSMEIHGRVLSDRLVPLDVAAEDLEPEVDEVETMKKRVENGDTGGGIFCIERGDSSRETQVLQALEILECSSASSEKTGGGDGIEDDDDVDMDEFCALIAQVRMVRDQGEFLNDFERRERAAEVALKLSKFLGELEDGVEETSSAIF